MVKIATLPKIFLIDSNLESIAQIRCILRHTIDFEIFSVSDLQNCIQIASQTSFDLFLLDITSLGEQALTFLQEIKNQKNLESKPVCAIFDSKNALLNNALFQMGITRFVNRPYKPSELRLLLRICLEKIEKDPIKIAIQELEFWRQENQQWIALLAHDLRNPLSALSMAIPFLKQDSNEDDLSFAVTVCKDVLLRLTRGIDNVAIQSLGNNPATINKMNESFSLPALLEEVVREVSPMFVLRKQNNKIEFSENLKEFIGSRSLIRSLCISAFSHACEVTPINGNIFCSIDFKENKWILQIEDQGTPVPENICDLFFDELALPALKYRGFHVGKGFSHVAIKKICNLHRGKVKIIPKNLIGNTLYIEFPDQNNTACF